MPKINEYINTNPKPVETVYEIKNEYDVPSFEEFMKSYENDGSLNYSDLESGSVGEVKGYGPCEKYCGWHNPKCTCYVNIEEGFMPLNTSCPACGTINSDGSGNFSKPHQWVHAGCGGQSYISRRVRLKCFRCGVEGHWKQWSFKCERHQQFKPLTDTSARIFITALNIASGNFMNATDNTTRHLIADIATKLWEEFRNEG